MADVKLMLAIFSEFAIPLGLLINAVTVLVLVWQIGAMRRSLRAQSYFELADRWSAVSEQEIKNPEFHKLLLGPRARAAVADASVELLRRRAFAHMVFDVVQQRLRADQVINGEFPDYSYLKQILRNHEFRELWTKYEIREVWDGDEFQGCIDKLVAEIEKEDSSMIEASREAERAQPDTAAA